MYMEALYHVPLSFWAVRALLRGAFAVFPTFSFPFDWLRSYVLRRPVPVLFIAHCAIRVKPLACPPSF